MSEVTQILNAIEEGQPGSATQLLELVYEELRRMASQRMGQERANQTLEATGLVHEAYLRLLASDGKVHFANRKHFFAAAANAMRRILVESARRKNRQKHGGEYFRVELADPPAPQSDEDLLALDAALVELAREDALAAKVVELRQFAGLSHEQIAETLEMTVYRARQKWTFARAWLRNALEQ